jgi:hypothetical protein
MFVQDFESSSLSSFTQTGLSLSTTNPLHGKVSALLTHQAAVNQSFKQVVAVDPKFRGQAMVLDLNIKSAASAGNVVIKVRDESNSADLIVSEALQLSSSVSGRRSSVSFTIPSTCSSLSYTITALPEAGSPVTRIDDIVSYLGDVALLETSVEVPVITAWQGYTPTFQGFGTPSAVEFEYRQVGENVEIRGKFVSGVSTAVEARVGLPAGLTSASTSLIPSLQIIGAAGRSANAAQSIYNVNIEPSVTYVTFGFQGASNSAISKVNATVLVGVGESLSFFASIPCAGLSATTTKTIPLTQSGLVQEGDGHYQLNNFTYRTASTATNTLYFNDGSIVANIGDHITKVSDSVNGDQFIATKTGTYSINVSVELGGTASGLYLVKNNTSATVANILASFYENGTNSVSNLSWSGYLVKGDIIRLIKAGAAATFAANDYNTIDIAYQGSLKQVSVSSDQKITIPTSELRFEGASSRGSTATAIVKFDTMAKLRGDAFTITNTAADGTYITMKKAGRLSISASLYVNSVSGAVSISKNQSNLTTGPTAAETLSAGGSTPNVISPVSWSGDVAVGDILRIYANAAPTANSSNNLNLSFQEQDISVSVTNTLPQFSESDSSVRVNTANGYGSTASNKIRRFSSVVENLGSDITYLDDSANGATFTIMSSGIYNVSYTDQFSAQCLMGLSKNASSLTTAIQSLAASQILAVANSVSLNQPESVSWQGYLSAGDIIRPHSEGTSAGTTTSAVNFTISKVGKPNVTGVDVTPFVNLPQPEIQSIEALSITSTFGSTNTGVPVLNITKNTNNGIIAIDSSATTGTSFRALKACVVEFTVSAGAGSSAAQVYLTRNATTLTISGSPGGELASSSITSSTRTNVSTSVSLFAGDVLRIQRENTGLSSIATATLTAEALSDQILTAPETFSTDTASLSYASSAAYTLSTLQNAPVGTFITFTYAINTNTRTQTTTRPTQTDADMNVNGIQMFARAYNAASTAAQPAAIAIQIGKGLKGLSVNPYELAGKVNGGGIDFYNSVSNTRDIGAFANAYNEKTGIYYVDFGYTSNTAVTSRFLGTFSQDSTASYATSGYLVINASKNPALTGLSTRPAALSTATGSAPSYSARAWVNFNGTGTIAIRSSGNVSSISDGGAGSYGVNFTTSMDDSNYSVAVSSSPDAGGGEARICQTITSQSATAVNVRLIRNDGAAIDSSIVSVIILK